jgi:dTDP-4-dehydrorhamnose 3,5-epimerase
MHFTRTQLADAFLIDIDPRRDHRGFFARTYCVQEFADHGLGTDFVQHSASHSLLKGTLRGMHFQRAPHGEIKVVSCRRGAIWDVIIDLRRESPSFGCWEGFELTAENHRQLYIPEGFAHGFQTLCADTEVGYLISTFYAPGSAVGLRYNDPAFAIDWPLPIAAISDADKAWPDFTWAPLPSAADENHLTVTERRRATSAV